MLGLSRERLHAGEGLQNLVVRAAIVRWVVWRDVGSVGFSLYKYYGVYVNVFSKPSVGKVVIDSTM